MAGLQSHRLVHWLVLLGIAGLLLFPGLGSTSLWDVDEGVNAEAAREMREAGTWIVPTFNWDLRTAKPVLLYWLMRLSYSLFDVHEWSARFPSALLSLLTLLLVYELGRRMFDALTGLLAGLILVSSFEFLKLAHAATPDATLIAFVVLYLTSFWLGHDRGGRSWFIPCGIASALAVLTKGPVGLVLPGAIVGAYLLAQRELSRVWDRRLVHGVLAWILVAVPWYAIVTAETRGEWLKAFIIDENLNRAAEPKENHSGWPVVYYLICLCLFFAPWSSFLYVTVREAYVRAVRSSDSSSPECRANRFLLIWIAVYFLAFSFAATKLPNYIAPLYPALAILAARWLLRWMRGEVLIERWLLISGQLGIGLTGLVVLLGFLVGGGVIPVPGAGTKLRIYPGLETWAWIGLFPILGAGAFGYFAAHQQRDRAVLALTSTTLVFLGLMAAFPFQVLDRYKAAKPLVIESEADRVDVDQRLGSFQFTQPSLVFYSQRRVEPFGEARTAADFLSNPHPSVLFVPQPVWESAVLPLVRAEYRIVSQHYDFSRNCNILAVRNRR